MPSRRSHEKSHHGCVTCKRRRVKCDETRPKCANCSRRGTECDYQAGYVSKTPQSTQSSGAPTPESAPNSYLGQVLDSMAPQISDPLKHGVPVSRHISASQMHDLFLMNTWTAATCKTVVDQEANFGNIWQRIAPAEAVSHPFLMHGILALSALHLASESHQSPEKSHEHRAIALRHHDQSIALFRPLLSKITAQNCHAMFGFSALLVILSFALPGSPLEETTKSPVQEILMIITLLKGVQGVLTSGIEWLQDGPFRILLDAGLMRTHGDMPDEFKAALSRLKAHSSSLYTEEADVVEVYGFTIDRLEQCVSRLYTRPLDRFVVLGWLIVVPDHFDALLREGQPMALVILAHFAVILLTFDFWWAGNWGSALIREIAQSLTDEWKPMVRWPLEQLTTMNAQSLKARLESQNTVRPRSAEDKGPDQDNRT